METRNTDKLPNKNSSSVNRTRKNDSKQKQMVLSTGATPLKNREKIVEEKPEELLYTYKKGDPFGAKARGLA